MFNVNVVQVKMIKNNFNKRLVLLFFCTVIAMIAKTKFHNKYGVVT